MHFSSKRADAPTVAEEGPSATRSPVVLSERSLVLLALVRIFVGLLWFQQLAWNTLFWLVTSLLYGLVLGSLYGQFQKREAGHEPRTI